MKRLASILMALFLGTTALVAVPSESQAQPRREDSYGRGDYEYRDRDRWDRRDYPRYHHRDRKYGRYDRYRPRYRHDRYDRYDRYRHRDRYPGKYR